MSLYSAKQLADSMRIVRKNTVAIAEDIPEAQYDYRPTQDSRSVRETLLHMASMTLFDLHIHEDQKRTSMEGFDFRGFFAGLPTNEKSSLPKSEIVAVLRDGGEDDLEFDRAEHTPEDVGAQPRRLRQQAARGDRIRPAARCLLWRIADGGDPAIQRQGERPSRADPS